MTDYSWLPYWLFGVVCIAFGFWLRGLFEQTQIAPDDPNAPEPLDEYDVMREREARIAAEAWIDRLEQEINGR